MKWQVLGHEACKGPSSHGGFGKDAEFYSEKDKKHLTGLQEKSAMAWFIFKRPTLALWKIDHDTGDRGKSGSKEPA